MKKDDLVILDITDCTTEGEGIGRADSFALFVKDAVVGDTVECRIMKLKKTYGYAKLVRIVRPSPDRISARCTKARPCGGCRIQEMDYRAALRFKTGKVRESLKRIGGFPEDSFSVEPCLGMEDPWRYRNKALVPFGRDRDGKIVAGFYAGRTHQIIEAEDCLIMPPEFSRIIREVKAFLDETGVSVYDEETGEGLFRHLLLRKGFRTGEIMAAAVLNGEAFPYARELESRLRALLSGEGLTLRSFAVNVNRTPGNVILSPDTRILSGDPFIEDLIGDIRFRISANSFFQVNPVMTERLYQTALEFAGLTGGETVWDLYSGIGSISLFLAKAAKKVYGVEVIPEAVRDARENATLNGISNAEFFLGKVEEVLPAWAEAHPDAAVDVIVTDPPREGCDPKCLETMLHLKPERIVYVSCNPSTLARDLKILASGGYWIDRVRPADMFPWSAHVETVVLLRRKNVDDYLEFTWTDEEYGNQGCKLSRPK